MQKLVSKSVERLDGRVRLPGDKSISHRALMLGSLAVGRTRIRNLLEGEDVLATAAAMRRMGAVIERAAQGEWIVDGVGVGGLHAPDDILDMGNSGTSTRLLMGLLASHPLRATFTGDASLRRRPMGRVIEPLSRMGAEILASEGGRLPLTLTGSHEPLPIDYSPSVASAQVKSAILLAALNTPGATIVREARATRDHSERMLKAMGAALRVEEAGDGGRIIEITGECDLRPVDIEVPGDISSAAFPLVAAMIVPGSEVTLEGVGVNPLRDGVLQALRAMGGRIDIHNERLIGGEPVADLTASAPDGLAAVDLDPAIAPRMIDEFPALFVAAACARGKSRFTGLEELRVKESDRLAVMARGLTACGVRLEEMADGILIEGDGAAPEGGALVAADLDHRIAMSFLILGCRSRLPVEIDDASPINTSFPGFMALMNGLGAGIAIAPL